MSRIRSLRARTADILEISRQDDPVGVWVDRLLSALIVANLIALVLETVEPIRALAPGAFARFELLSVIVFSAEYVLRVWSCIELPGYERPLRGRLRYALSPMALADLLAIAPFYAPALGIDLRSVRAVRLLRLLRLAKLGRYSETMRTFARVLSAKRDELVALMAFLAILLVLSSSVMYFAEHEAQPEKFSSIPKAMWWGVATLTTVGYGDVAPVTAIGRLLGSFIAVLGIGMFALPTGILGAAFADEIERSRRGQTRCPHCHEPVEITELESSPGADSG